MKEILGEHIHTFYGENKKAEWADYIKDVSEWELNRYLQRHLADAALPAMTRQRRRAREILVRRRQFSTRASRAGALESCT